MIVICLLYLGFNECDIYIVLLYSCLTTCKQKVAWATTSCSCECLCTCCILSYFCLYFWLKKVECTLLVERALVGRLQGHSLFKYLEGSSPISSTFDGKRKAYVFWWYIIASFSSQLFKLVPITSEIWQFRWIFQISNFDIMFHKIVLVTSIL